MAGIGFDIKPSGTLASSVAGRGSGQQLAARPGHGNSVELRLQKIRRARREREQAREAEL